MNEPSFSAAELAAPELRPDDSWAFAVRTIDSAARTPLRVDSRVVAVDAHGVEMTVRRGEGAWLRTWLDPVLGVRGRELAPGECVHYSPALAQLRFPLQVGARWSAEVSQQQDDWWQDDALSTSGETLGAEWIELPAGRFAALRLHFGCATPHARIDAELWYAPAAARIVRGIEHTRSGDDDPGVRVEFELLELNRLRAVQ